MKNIDSVNHRLVGISLSLLDRVQSVLEEDDFLHDVSASHLKSYLGTDPDVHFEIVAKEPSVFCGNRWSRAFADLGLFEIVSLVKDGAHVNRGDRVLVGRSKLCSTLSFERSLLNGLQRWSGVATLTHLCVHGANRAHELWSEQDRAKWAKPKILHTRKTTPLWRDLEVEAVLSAGGFAHRMSLSDRPMVKENHKEPVLRARGEWRDYLRDIITKYPQSVIEVETWHEARDVVSLGATCLMLDNFSSSELKRNLPGFLSEMTSQGYELPLIEVSGGISPSNLEDYVIPGVSRISMGALTHAYRSIDLSLNILRSAGDV